MFNFNLTAQDMAELTAIQGGHVRTCSDCWKDSCRACQAAMKKAGCNPWSGPTCLTCVEASLGKEKAEIMAVCKDEPMVYKACVNN